MWDFFYITPIKPTTTMMKNYLLAAAATLLSFAMYAQEIPFKIQKSEVFKDEYKRSSIISVTEDNNGGTVIVRSFSGGVMSKAHGYYFEHYDASMKLINEFEYELKRGRVLGLMVNDDKVNIVAYSYDKDAKAYIGTVSSADINNFKFETSELFRLEREEIEGGGLFGGGSYDSDNSADMLVNRDRTAFAISIDIVDKKSETHKLFVYDHNMKQTLEHTFKRDIKDKKFRFENIDISDDGKTIYLLGKVHTPENKKKKEGGKYQYELSKINKDGAKTQVFDTDEHFAASLKTIYANDKITCVGFYSDRKDSRFKGLCYYELDPNSLAIKNQKFNKFTEQFIIDKYGKEKDKELKNISFRDIIITAKNEIVFNAEEYYEVSHYHASPNGGGYWSTTYHYDDIVSAKLSQTGDLMWARNINKRQATGGDESYISYTSTVKGDDTYFFINSGEKVKKLKNDRIQFGQTSTKRSNLNIIRINGNGDFDYQEVLDDKDNEVPFMVAHGAITDNSTIYFIGRKGKKKQLLKVTI